VVLPEMAPMAQFIFVGPFATESLDAVWSGAIRASQISTNHTFTMRKK
jgi:hypothetical protein